MKYVTIINEEQYEIEIDKDGGVLLNGEPRDVDFLNLGGSLYSVITQNQSLEVVIDDEDNTIEVMMNGRLYETQVLDERALLMAQRRGGLGGSSGEVHSPMPGLIVLVAVENGQVVEQGQTVVILESMKMQNELKAPINGTVSAIHVEAGQTVDKNAFLIEIEPPEEE
jgi:biotin carboxyl carrier protein